MDDLIRRQDALTEIRKDGNWLEEQGVTSMTTHERELRDTFILREMPSAQQWIPCSERLPKRKDETQMRGYYLTTNAYGSVGLTKYEFEGGGLGYAWDSDIRIVAWMPLPAPYKEE